MKVCHSGTVSVFGAGETVLAMRKNVSMRGRRLDRGIFLRGSLEKSELEVTLE